MQGAAAALVVVQGVQAWAPPVRAEEKAPADDMVGATFDTGIGKQRAGASSFGARYVRLHGFPSSEGGAAWLGYGVDARAVVQGSIDGGLFNLVGRAGVGIGGGGLEVEPVVGVGIGPDVMATGGVAVLYGFPWFGVGLSTQFPLGAERPPWLEKLQVVLRFQLALEPCRSRFFSCAAKQGMKTER